MRSLAEYSIKVRGLAMGEHEFTFDINDEFFNHFENSPIEKGSFEVWLSLTKRSHLMELNFEFDGFMLTSCDRCLVEIQLPVYGDNRLLVKFQEEEELSGEEHDEVIYISQDAPQLDLSRYLYEFLAVSVPIVKTYDCENDEEPPCDESMLEHLATKTDEAKDRPSVWDSLKDLK